MTIAPDFDPVRLERFLGGRVHLEAVNGGQSNPTWFLTCKGQALVLRKKPAGATLDSAHAVDREFRILSALQGSGVPVLRVVRMVDDPAVIGTPFYLMERLIGHVSDGTDLPGLAAQDRGAIHLDAARVLARLHALGLARAGAWRLRPRRRLLRAAGPALVQAVGRSGRAA